jgi:hypothetical protein
VCDAAIVVISNQVSIFVEVTVERTGHVLGVTVAIFGARIFLW